jgi:hypothetical protein
LRMVLVLLVVFGGGCFHYPSWRTKNDHVSEPCGVSEYCDFVTTTTRRCGDGGVRLLGGYFPNYGRVGDV